MTYIEERLDPWFQAKRLHNHILRTECSSKLYNSNRNIQKNDENDYAH